MKSNLVNKPLWFVLIILSAGIALWFSQEVLIGAFRYLQLDSKTAAHISSFSVREAGSRYVYEAEYSYEVGKKKYSNKTLFCEPVYLNRLSAEADLEKCQQFPWEAWYNSDRPQESSLQKFFPFKKAIYALLSLGVFIYFCLFYIFKQQIEK